MARPKYHKRACILPNSGETCPRVCVTFGPAHLQDPNPTRMLETPTPYLSTAEAAHMLGISTTLVQTLVDTQELEGWRTRGGHRRIALESVRQYQTRTRPGRARAHSGPLEVVVVSEQPDGLSPMHAQVERWAPQLTLTLRDSVSGTLLELGERRPDVLVVELSMPRLQQEKTVQALQAYMDRSPAPAITLLTEETALLAAPHSRVLQLAPGPLTPAWLEGFLSGVQAAQRTHTPAGAS